MEFKDYQKTIELKKTNNVSEYQYLIIGGSTKCGTTSLFNYLSEHPDICAASIKESRFFLSQQNPLESRFRLEMDGIESYGNFFLECSDRIRVEATPDYLYSDFAATNIRKHLPGAKMVFILRDPVERLQSWYKFARQRALMEGSIPFEDYVDWQLSNSVEEHKEQHMHALEQGRYSAYLNEYLTVFDEERVLILSFNDLKSEPGQVLKRICRFANIDESVYEDYHFEVFNKTHAVKNQSLERAYIRIQKKLRFLFQGNKLMMRILTRTNRMIRYMMRMNQAKMMGITMSGELSTKLDDYYSEERVFLDTLFRK